MIGRCRLAARQQKPPVYMKTACAALARLRGWRLYTVAIVQDSRTVDIVRDGHSLELPLRARPLLWRQPTEAIYRGGSWRDLQLARPPLAPPRYH